MLGIDTSLFMPHGHCILWRPELLFPIVASDIAIFLSYTSIPFCLFSFYRKRTDLSGEAKRILLLFVFFILFCGVTHIISAYNYWNSEYVLEMFFKVLTAVVSIATAYTMFRIAPTLLKIPKPSEHQKVIDELKAANLNLEKRVDERTTEINHQKELLNLILEGHETGVVRYIPIYNQANQVVDFKNEIFNERALSTLGVKKREDLETNSLLSKYPEIRENGHFENAIEALKTGRTVVVDPYYAPWFNRFLRMTIFKNPVDQNLFVCYSDVTERENTKIQSVAQSKLIALGELAGGVAHEINTPIQIIAGKLRKIERTQSELINKSSKEDFDRISTTLKSVQDIIKNLKELSSEAQEAPSNINLKNVVNESARLYREKSAQGNISVNISDSIPENLEVIANKTTLFQAICNLLSNAIDALLDDKGLSNRQITISGAFEDGKFHLSVADNAPLIPPEIAERIFDPLFTTKEPGKGTGLGLSVSSKLVENFGGRILLEQESQKKFIIEIPISNEGASS